jgi:hypothetical protein
MSSIERVLIGEVIATSGDLAVADRQAFLAARARQSTLIVVSHDGWFVACAVDQPLDVAQIESLRADSSAPQIMSIVTSRGIVPMLGPLAR